MPIRRSSATVSPGPPFSSPSSRSREGDTSSISDFTVQISANGGVSENKVVSVLVGRLVNKLPCNSGIRLEIMEVDPAIRHAVDTLLQLVKIRQGLVLQALGGALETLSKYANGAASDMPLDILHSQLYILNILLQALSTSWRAYAETHRPPVGDLPRCFPDFPPLDESLARYLLAVVMLFGRSVSMESSNSTRTSSPAPSREKGGYGTSSSTSLGLGISPGSGSNPLGPRFIQRHSFPSGSSSLPHPAPLKTLAGECGTLQGTTSYMSKVISRIIFILSTSNWNILLAKIKNRVSFLTTTIEDSPDLVELRLLEWSNLDRTRLASVLQEVSSTFLHVKRPAQISIASVLRKAIWNWVDVHPSELQNLVETNRKIEGGAEALFNLLSSGSDLSSSSHARRTRAFYPLMAMLLVICPDLFKKAAMGDMGGRSLGGLTKKVSFLDSLQKGVGSSKAFEACTICYVDIVRAAMSISPKYQSSGLRSLVPDIQNDLKNALFFSPMASEITDPGILVDGLVALYRASPFSMTPLVFGRLLAESNEVNRIAAIRACQVVFLEDGRLPWYPPASDLRDTVAAAVRNVLKAKVTTLIGDANTLRRPSASPDFPSGQNDLITEILKLYIVDPQYAISGTTPGPTDSLSELLRAISSLLVSPSPDDVREAAVRCIVALLDAMAEADEAALGDCGAAVWTVLIDVGRQGLFAIQSESEDINHFFTAFREIAISLCRFASKQPDLLANSTRGEAAVLLGLVAMVTVLMSPDFEQLTQSITTLRAMKTLTLIAHKVYLPGSSPQGTNFNSPQLRIAMRCRFFDEISRMPPTAGRHQQQRHFRKMYKPFAVPTTGGIAIWLGSARLAKHLTSLIIAADASSMSRNSHRRGLAPDIDGLDEGQSKIWQNLTLFLASTANVCKSVADTPSTLVDVIGKGVLPRLYEDLPNATAACEEFIRECVDLLVSGSIHVRETVKEALGQELPGNWMRIMIDHMKKLLGHSIGGNGASPSETFTTFVEQIIIVLRMAVDRLDPAEQDVQVDLGDLMSMLAQYTSRLGRDEIGLRIKIKFCQLVEAISSKADCVTLLNEGTLKNTILDSLIEWSIEAQRDAETSRHSMESTMRLNRDVELATLKAMVPVTEGLSLRGPGEDSETTLTAVKTRLFYKYYTHLSKMLEPTHSSENDSNHARSLSLSGPARTPLAEDSSNLVIAALSNLLSANLDVGLKLCLSMGYHEDPALRTAFMRLLTNILQQGARFGGLTSKRQSTSPTQYLDVLTQNPDNFALAVAICEVCPPGEVDEISTMLFRVFEAKGLCLAFMKTLVEREIALTNHESELFRANSITTRLLTTFARTYGYNYLRGTLQPMIHSLIERPAECSFELDPNKAGPNDDIERNADRLQFMCQTLLDFICASTPRVPIMFRALCHHLWEVTADRFPESRHSVIGSFIFLRFFCPAIVAPGQIDLDISPDTPEIRRALLLITKVIQNLANNAMFGNKEPHMKVLNTFLSEKILPVSKFLSDLGVKPRGWEVEEAVKQHQEEAIRACDHEGDETILHRFVSKHFNKLEAALNGLPQTFRPGPDQGGADRKDLDGAAAMSNLRALVARTALAADVKKMTASARSQAYDEFMRRNAGRSTDTVSEAFYEGPISQNGNRIFYFIFSRVGLLDYDLLAYHVFSILEKVTDFFDLVIDLTDFSASNELPLAWLRRSMQMCPPGVLPCINTLALYNPNTYALRRVRRIMGDLASIVSSVGKQVIAASSPSELAEVIPFSSLALPEYTMALAFEADHVFTNLLCLADHGRQVPVVVKLGHDCIQVASWRKYDLTTTVKSYIIDVIRLRDIDDILTGGSLPTDHLMIKHSQNESVTFVSRKRNEMAQIIRAARSRLRDGPSEERSLRPSDVPGTLLNVALLNLSSGDETLRLGAYNLVYELSGYFRWEMATTVLKATAGLSIPQNSLAFTYSLSSALAQSAPHLTPEFLKEWTIGFSRGNDVSQKCAALHYVTPWLANLENLARPSKEKEDVEAGHKIVSEVIRGFVSVTVAERRRLHLAIHEHIWSRLAKSHDSFAEILTAELMRIGTDAGAGSEKAECTADILVSMGGTNVRGRVIARLRKVIASTYLRPSPTLTDNVAWPEICALSRMVLALSFNPASALDAQLFLPELCHIITVMLGSGPLLVRQTVYGIAVNLLQSLSSSRSAGEMDTTNLQRLWKTLQGKEMIRCFGLAINGTSFELVKIEEDKLLGNVEEVTKFLGEVVVSAAVSIDCANTWRARWMSLVAATCFQHNPSTQPQAFTVLGHLASDEVDDDTVYQILVAMSTTLAHFSETDNTLLVAMLRCLCRIIPGLLPDSRYATSLFWLAIGVLELGHIPPFAAALELILVSLRAVSDPGPLVDVLLQARAPAEEPARRLDQFAGVDFDLDPGFSFVAVLYKGIRHPGTRKLAVEAMAALLTDIVKTTPPDISDDAGANGGGTGRLRPRGKVVEDAVGLLVALLPVLAAPPGSSGSATVAQGGEAVEKVFKGLGIDLRSDLSRLNLLHLLSIPDQQTALLLVVLVTTILQTASSEIEKIILYRLLAEASAEMPEVMNIVYDTLIPRLTAVLSTTSTLSILDSVSTILQNALSDSNYNFPTTSTLTGSDSVTSFQHANNSGLGHTKSFSGSVSSLTPSMAANAPRDQVVDDLGMRGLMDLSFGGKGERERERIVVGARWVAALIDQFTS